jgi:hypothetical protein
LSGCITLEFIIVFGKSYSENEEAELCSRIITSPIYVKQLLDVLKYSVEQYEQRFGKIEEE